MTSKASDLQSLSGADPLHVLINIELIRIGKVVAKPLHIFAIANMEGAVAASRSRLQGGTPARAMEWSVRGGGGGGRVGR